MLENEGNFEIYRVFVGRTYFSFALQLLTYVLSSFVLFCYFFFENVAFPEYFRTIAFFYLYSMKSIIFAQNEVQLFRCRYILASYSITKTVKK